MDARHFDALTRLLGDAGSRRGVLAILAALPVLGGLVSGVPRPLVSEARGKKKRKHRDSNKGKGKGKDRTKDKKRNTAQGDGCWRAGACIPGKGANVSRCDLSSTSSFPGLNCTGSNLSRANLRGVNVQGANFTKANLSGACLIGANFTGAIFANNTNLANAIFCQTIMPDGRVNDSGCGLGTACCPTCTPDSCRGLQLCCEGRCTTPARVWTNTPADNFGASTTMGYPAGIALSSDEMTIWVTDYIGRRVTVWKRANASSPWTNTPADNFGSQASMSGPVGIALSSDEMTLWVTDYIGRRVTVWKRANASSPWTNTPADNFGAEASMGQPRGIGVASDEMTIWVTDSNGRRVTVWKRANASSPWTNTPADNFGAEASMGQPRGIGVASDEMTIWVTDSNGGRVTAWKPDLTCPAEGSG